MKINLTRLLFVVYHPKDEHTTCCAWTATYEDNTSTEKAYAFELENEVFKLKNG